jgi:hypothetical protein
MHRLVEAHVRLEQLCVELGWLFRVLFICIGLCRDDESHGLFSEGKGGVMTMSERKLDRQVSVKYRLQVEVFGTDHESAVNVCGVR